MTKENDNFRNGRLGMDDNSQPQTELDRNEKRRKKHYEKKKEKRQAARAVARTESRDKTFPPQDGLSTAWFELGITNKKGCGLFALRSIPCGTCIFSEKPIFTASSTTTASEIKEIIQHLTKRKCDAFTNLSYSNDCNTARKQSLEDHLHDIFLTNRYTPLHADKRDASIYATISRMNHDCTPNIFLSLAHDGIGTTVRAHAVHDIDVGEELTHAYVNEYQGADARARELSAQFPGIGDCLCRLCHHWDAVGRSTYKQVLRSHLQRTKITELYTSLADLMAARPSRLAEARRCAADMAKLMLDEKLCTHKLAGTYRILAELWAGVSREEAGKAKRKEFDILVACFGSDSPITESVEAEWASTKTHV